MSLTFTRLALHCLHPCLLLVWKRREGMASDREELYPDVPRRYRRDYSLVIIGSCIFESGKQEVLNSQRTRDRVVMEALGQARQGVRSVPTCQP